MTEPKRKLIFCWPYVEWGGAQIYFMAIMKVARADWDVVAIFPEDSPADVRQFLDEIGVRYETLDFTLDLAPARGVLGKLRRQLNRVKVEHGLLRHLKRYNLRQAILHIETSPWQSWIFLTLLRLRGANVFVTMHNAISGPAWRQMVWKLRMRFVTSLRGFNLLVSNKDTKNRIRSWASEKFWSRIPVTYTCVDPEQIANVSGTALDKVRLRANLGIEKNETVILSVGQFIDRKGRWTMVEAAKILEPSHPNLKFLWVTPQLPSAADQEMLRRFDAKNFRLIRSGDIGSTREDVLSFFRLADIFALPSYVEGLPIALLEAMALGIPSISTNVYAIPEAVFHNQTGLLVEPGEAQALADAIAKLAADSDLGNRLSEAGRDFVLANFDERHAAALAIEAYNRCFADAPATAK